MNPDFLKIAKQKMFFSLKWIIAKFIAYSIDEIVVDIEKFKEFLQDEKDEELNLIEETLNNCKKCENIDLDAGTIPRYIYENMSDKTHLENIESLVNECKNWVTADDKLKKKN